MSSNAAAASANSPASSVFEFTPRQPEEIEPLALEDLEDLPSLNPLTTDVRDEYIDYLGSLRTMTELGYMTEEKFLKTSNLLHKMFKCAIPSSEVNYWYEQRRMASAAEIKQAELEAENAALRDIITRQNQERNDTITAFRRTFRKRRNPLDSLPQPPQNRPRLN